MGENSIVKQVREMSKACKKPWTSEGCRYLGSIDTAVTSDLLQCLANAGERAADSGLQRPISKRRLGVFDRIIERGDLTHIEPSLAFWAGDLYGVDGQHRTVSLLQRHANLAATLKIFQCSSRQALGILCSHFDQSECTRTVRDNISYIMPDSDVSRSTVKRTATSLAYLTAMNGNLQPGFSTVGMTNAERVILLNNKYPRLPGQVRDLFKQKHASFYSTGIFTFLVQTLISHPVKAVQFWKDYMSCIEGGRYIRGPGDLYRCVGKFLQQEVRGAGAPAARMLYNRAAWAFLRFIGQEKKDFAKTKVYSLGKVSV